MFPSDALTISHEQVGAGVFQFLPAGTTRYILGVSVQQSGQASDTLLKCGTSIFSRNYGKDAIFQQLSYKCSDAVTLDKTGNDSSFITVTYVPRDISTTQNASVSAQYIEFGNNALSGINGVSWIIFFGFGLMILLTGIRAGFMFMQK